MMKGYDSAKNRPGGLQSDLPGFFDFEIPGRISNKQEGPETRDVSANQGRKKRAGEIFVSSIVVQVGFDGAVRVSGIVEIDAHSDIWPKLSADRKDGKVPFTPDFTVSQPKVWTLLIRLVSRISEEGRATLARVNQFFANRDKEENGG